jgi:cysteinyl-tRNA synthetase
MFYDETEPWTGDDWQWILTDRVPNLQKVLDAGHPVFSVDYVDNGMGYLGENKSRIDDYYKKCHEYGYIPYAARKDRALDELNIIKGVQP